MLVAIDEIQISHRHRPVQSKHVRELANSIADVGLLNPITVDRQHDLIAGLHRLEAVKSLGWEQIECTECDLDGLQAEMAEIDENYIRYDLSSAERGELLLRRKELYETLHPETKQGGDRKSAEIKTTKCRFDFPKSFTQDTAEKLNVSPRTVEREIKVARDLTPTTKEILKSSEKEVTQKNALKLSRLKPQQQEEAAKLLAEGKIRSVDEYSPAHRGTAIEKTQDNPPPKPRQTVSTVAPEKETKTDEATKPPAKKQPTTLSEIVADLKNHDKDASATPEAFIASFVSFASRMEGEIAWYGQEYYRPVFSRLSPEQMTQLHEMVLRIGAAAESIYFQVQEFRKKGALSGTHNAGRSGSDLQNPQSKAPAHERYQENVKGDRTNELSQETSSA